MSDWISVILLQISFVAPAKKKHIDPMLVSAWEEAMLNILDFLFSFIACFTVKQAIARRLGL